VGYLHQTGPYQRLRRRFREVCRRTNARCYICIARGNYEMAGIDYSATSGPWMFEVHHIRSVEEYPELVLCWENLAASHRRCNRQLGTKDLETQGGRWIKPTW
jgi:hypothetical protein